MNKSFKRAFPIIYLFFVLNAFVNGQELNIDSLIMSLEIEENDTIKLNTYDKIINFYNYKKPVKALPFAKSGVELAEDFCHDKFLAKAYNNLGVCYYFLENTNKASEYFMKCLILNERNKDSLSISKILNNLGISYLAGNDLEKALEFFDTSLKMKIKLKEKETLWTAYANIALVYKELNKLDKVKENLDLAKKAWTILDNDKDESYALILSEYGSLFIDLNELDSAQIYFFEAMKLLQKSKSTYREASVILRLAEVFRGKGNLSLAESFIENAMKLSKQSGAAEVFKDCQLELSLIEETRGNYAKALEYSNIYHYLKDSLQKDQDLKEIEKIREFYLVEQQEAEKKVLRNEIALNNAKIEKRNILNLAFLSFILFLIIFAFQLIRSNRKRRKINVALREKQNIILDQNEELQEILDKLKNTQHQLIHSEKMASIGVLASGVAHEINNPLNYIQGGVFGLEQYIEENLKEHKDKLALLIEYISSGIERTANIVSSLNYYSRKHEKSFVKCDIHSIIDNSLIILQSKTENRIQILKNYTNTPYDLSVNEGDMHQAILKILLNAVQAIDDSGTIEIQTTIIEQKLIIQITDSGCGISPENLPKIFDPFFTTKETGEGTGLGLSITYNIIEEHNGTIEIESNLGKGSTFIISLPLYIEKID